MSCSLCLSVSQTDWVGTEGLRRLQYQQASELHSEGPDGGPAHSTSVFLQLLCLSTHMSIHRADSPWEGF